MSSSAILSYGTGQAGQLEQMVLNLAAPPPPFNSWFENAKTEGRQVAIVGDSLWKSMYGPHLDMLALDPPGAPLQVDFNEQTFRDARKFAAEKPDFLIAHFTTPDHQGHAYGVQSPQYRKHMAAYDDDLRVFLSEFGPEWTVIVTSDHGATDGGSHGIDTVVQRRAPLYAYGPGIRSGIKLPRAYSQLELSNTLAVMIGVSAPAHSRGHAMIELLDIDAEQQAHIACAEATRIARLSAALDADSGTKFAPAAESVCAESDGPEAVAASRALLMRADAEVLSLFGFSSPLLLWLLGLASLLALGAGLALLGRRATRAMPALLVLTAVTIAMVYGVERFEGDTPDRIRIAMFTVLNLVGVALLLFPARTLGWLESKEYLAPAVLPGLIVVCYPANAQPESLAAVAVLPIVFGLSGHLASKRQHLLSAARIRIERWRMLWLLPLLLVLVPAGIFQNDVHLPKLMQHRTWVVAGTLAILVAWPITRAKRLGWSVSERRHALIGAAVLVAATLYRNVATPTLGRLTVIVLLLAAIGMALSRRRSLALYAGMASYIMLALDGEIVPVLATIVLAEMVGDTLCDHPEDPVDILSANRRRVLVALVATFAFGLIYVQRIAIQGGLDIGTLTPTATFGDPSPPWWIMSVAMTLKWLIPAVLALAMLISPVAAWLRATMVRVLVVLFVARTAVLLVMLGLCGHNFWTGTRCIGELPFALLAAVAAGVLWLGAYRLTGPIAS
jgi:hypothetical protein